MSTNTLERRPLTNWDGIQPGRQVKLGDALPDARQMIEPSLSASQIVGLLQAHGYAGTIEQVLTNESRFAVTIPEGTRGTVALMEPGRNIAVIFVWKTPKSNKVTAACVRVHYGQLVNHRGAPPLPGAPMPGQTPLTRTADPSPSLDLDPAPSMLQTLTATPTPSTPAPTTPAPAAGSLDAILSAIVAQQVEHRITALEDRLAAMPTGAAVHHVRINNSDPVTLSRRPHAKLSAVLARMQMLKPDGSRFNVFLTGDAGTGKSSIAKDCAEVLGLPFVALNCSGGLTEGALVGRMTPNLTTGAVDYTPGPLVRAYRDGGVFLLDELDAADENVLLVLNSLIDAPEWHTPTGDIVARSERFYLLAAGNTYGTGASRLYSGRTQLDAAFLNRWLTVPVDYDTELEKAMTATAGLADRIHAARAAIRSRNLRRWLTTRDLFKADALVQQLGVSLADALTEITEGWTAEDRAVAGLN